MPTSMFLQKRSEGQLSLAIAIVTLLTVASTRPLPAREPDLGVDALFELGMKNTPSAVTAARLHYERLKRKSPLDRRIDYAYGVVLLNQHKYLESLEQFADLPIGGQADLASNRAKAWALVQARKVSEALKELVKLSQSFQHSGDRDSNRESFTETARFIGVVFGYLELARPGAVDLDLRTSQRNTVLKNLGDRYVPQFDAGHSAVAERLAGLKSDQKLVQDRKAAASKERHERDQAALAGDREEIATAEEAMQWHLDSIREAQRELIVTKTQLDSLRTDRTRLGAQIVTAQARVSELSRDTRTVLPTTVDDRRLPGRPDLDFRYDQTTTSNTILGATDPRFVQIATLAMSLGRLNKQAFDMDRRILSLQQRSAELSEQNLRDVDALNRNDTAAQRRAKHAKAMEKKINRESAAKPSTPALTSQMSALSTYLPFPYEQERKRVLAWFEKE